MHLEGEREEQLALGTRHVKRKIRTIGGLAPISAPTGVFLSASRPNSSRYVGGRHRRHSHGSTRSARSSKLLCTGHRIMQVDTFLHLLQELLAREMQKRAIGVATFLTFPCILAYLLGLFDFLAILVTKHWRKLKNAALLYPDGRCSMRSTWNAKLARSRLPSYLVFFVTR